MRTISNSAWPIILVSGLSVAFFVGGVLLEIEAAERGLKPILKNKPELLPELLKEALSFQNDRIQRIHAVATAAIDLAKIGLGAVVALATQYVTSSPRNEP
ncbi:MAG: hypothetical protein V4858_22685 [Pseudomonadota bacterium]